MAIDVRGIRNVGDFYSQHYLDALLGSDLDAIIKRWVEEEKAGKRKAPFKQLAGLEQRFFKAASRAAGEAELTARLAAASEFHAYVLEALGYERKPDVEPVGEDAVVPVLFSARVHGRPFLWIVEAPFARDEEDADPLEESPLPEQLPESAQGASLAAGTWKELFDGALFRQDHPPRWVLLLAGSDAFLIDRHKWPQGKYLHFELGSLLGLREPKALQALAGLLHRDVLVPEDGQCLLDTLDENSHKHAFAVSTDLKLGAQRAIELLGNEAVHHLRTVSKEGVFGEGRGKQLGLDFDGPGTGSSSGSGLGSEAELDPAALTRECVTYLYRLLFLFYVEARGAELGVVPMNSDAYREGYSLEKLRELELVPLTSVEAREGYYIEQSLRRLFRLIQRGFGTGQLHLQEGDAPSHHTFTMTGLRSPLFDEERTPIFKRVKLRNAVMQEVLQLLSLSQEKGKQGRGRISYAQLGINQLGAVYEGLLSYRGFFAAEELHEVRAKGEVKDPSARTFFVPKSKLDDYHDEEKVRDVHGRPVRHAKGTYLFRLAGRDREKGASYYTPEVLTQCLTKYTLKERLGEAGKEGALAADELLELTVCEPAMGSGAFLNEAVGQLSHAYLERKQAELKQQIPADEYQREWQRVKYHFAVNNCYGVDLNPLATELGKISLWLNILQPGVEAPYFDQRLAVGNSLIGARREVFDSADLQKSGKDSWLHLVPKRVPLGQKRLPGTVYHFLVPDLGMAPFDDDKVVSELEPKNIQRITEWRRAFCGPFTEDEVAQLEALSDRIDELWARHVLDRQGLLATIRQPLKLWGQPEPKPAPGENAPRWKSVEECEEHARRLERIEAPGKRLEAVMDAWCALWFWPIREAMRLPSREEWLGDVEALLEPLGAPPSARLAVAQATAERHRFQHWELQFAEVFAERGGMDVFLGNPPWIVVQWSEAGVLGDYEPSLVLRKLSAKQVADKRKAQLGADARGLAAYLDDFEETVGTSSALSALQAYPLLQGSKTNLYKAFMVRMIAANSSEGWSGLIHQKGLYDDPKGGALRRALAERLGWHLHFINKLLLFSEIEDQKHYEFSVLAGRAGEPRFRQVSNLFHPKTLNESVVHDGLGPVPGIRSVDGWDLRGHRSRVVNVDADTLALFAKLYDSPGTPATEARLPVVHSQEILEVLRRFAAVPRTLADLGDEYFATEHFHETNQQKDGTIRRETRAPKSVDEWVVSGPHFYVGTPFNKTPNEGCKHNQDYSPIDLTIIPDDYLPRTNYVPACSNAEYRKRTPQWRGRPVTEFYRHVHRRMLAPTGERTLVPAIIPPGVAHIHPVLSVTLANHSDLVTVSALASALPIDFFVKSTGKSDLYGDAFAMLAFPALTDGRIAALRARALRLNCLTTHYAELWSEVCPKGITKDGFAKRDPRLESWSHLKKTWSRDSALRTPYARRQALVELDALAALALGLTLEQLILIYRVQFPVLQQYERETFYDQRGKLVFTTNRGLTGVGLSRKEWEEIKDAPKGAVLPEWAHDQQGAFVPPFDSCSREDDMAEAYEYFSNVLGGE